MTEYYAEVFKAFLNGNGFYEHEYLNNKIFKSTDSIEEFEHYNDKDLMQDEYKKEIDIVKIKSHFEKYFYEMGYDLVKPLPIANDIDTLFAIAGVQYFNKLDLESETKKDKILILQPVFRSQFINRGHFYSSSFINPATIIINPTLDEHFLCVKHWLNFLKKTGFEKNRLFIYYEKNKRMWGSLEFETYDLKFRYLNLKYGIGLASFSPNFILKQKLVTLSDIGFGLERMAWLINKGNYAYTLFNGNEITTSNLKILDYCKSLCLLMCSNVKPGNNNQGYRVRKLTKLLVIECSNFSIELKVILFHFYLFWSNWVDNMIEFKETFGVFVKEFTRNYNRLIIDKLNFKGDSEKIDINISTAIFVNRLIGIGFLASEIEIILNTLNYDYYINLLVYE